MIEILSWNVNKQPLWRHRAWVQSFDLGLFQEAPRPAGGDALEIIPACDGEWRTEHWHAERRTCIARFSDTVGLVPRGLRPAHDTSDYAALGVSRTGTLTVADVLRGEDVLFTVVSAYGAWESPTDTNDFIYSDASAHRLLSDLSAIVTGRRGERVLVAGDFNTLHGYGEHGSDYWSNRYATVFSRAEAMGLEFVGPQSPHGRQAQPRPDELPPDSRNVPTFHHSRQNPETATRQLDYVFATAGIAALTEVQALNDPQDWGPSDHCRLRIRVGA